MSEAVAFLTAVARYLSAARLYGVGHAAREEALEEVVGTASSLLERTGEASFSFLPGRVVFRGRPVSRLEEWEWAPRFAEAGVRRMELSAGLTRQEVEAFLRELAGRLLDEGPETGEGDEAGEGDGGDAPAIARWPHVRFGEIDVEEDGEGEEGSLGKVRLDDEAEGVGELHERAAREGRIRMEQAQVVVRSLSVAMRQSRSIVVPFVRLKKDDQYTAAHCLNVSLLSMALAEAMDLPEDEVRAVGMAGLLHDIGKVDVPDEVLAKPGELTEEDWDEIRRHPVHGARILMESGPDHRLPVMVTYEHHRVWNGGGYPELHFDRTPLPESRLVQVCDFYDALRTRRRYRKPMMAAAVVDVIERQAGEQLDPRYTRHFVELLRRWDPASLLLEIRPEEHAEEEGDGADAGEPA